MADVSFATPVILFLHNRYRVAGGEERAVEDLLWLVREHLGEEAELLGARQRHAGPLARGGGAAARRPASPTTWPPRCAARARGSVSAHNLNPAFGWRALAAARGGGRARRAAPAQLPARVRGRDVLQQPRRGLHALPGPQHAAGRAAELPRHRRRGGRLRRVAGAVAAPAGGAGRRGRRARRASRASACGALRAPARSGARPRRAPRRCARFAERSRAAAGEHALVAARLAPEKGVELAIAGVRAARACRSSWPATARRRAALRAAGGARFVGRVSARGAGRPARPRRAGDRALALGRDLRPGRGRGDGRRRPGGGHARSARCPSSSAPTGSWRRATPMRSPPPRGRASATRRPARGRAAAHPRAGVADAVAALRRGLRRRQSPAG